MWRESKLQHPSRSHPPPAPAPPAAVSQGRGEGYCELRSSTCFIHGSLHPARIFLPESFQKKLNINYLGEKKKTNHQETLQSSIADIGSLQRCGLVLRRHIPWSKPAVSGLVSLTKRGVRWPWWLVGPSQNSWQLSLFPL